jgi:phage-related protein
LVILIVMKVTFASAASGRSYFEKFLQGLSVQDRAVILAVFQDIQTHGLEAKGCEFRQLEGKLWEVKVRAPTGGYRFFYVLLASDHMRVLHSYKKQGQKAPPKELAVARKRLKEVLDEK